MGNYYILRVNRFNYKVTHYQLYIELSITNYKL